MRCPYCEGRTKVEECASNGVVVFRRRICTECGRLSWTEERFSLDSGTDKTINKLRYERKKERRSTDA